MANQCGGFISDHPYLKSDQQYALTLFPKLTEPFSREYIALKRGRKPKNHLGELKKPEDITANNGESFDAKNYSYKTTMQRRRGWLCRLVAKLHPE